MMLYLRCQVEAFAFSDKKWGTPEALDAEFERRQALKKAKKNKKFQARLDDLRKRTKSNLHVKRLEEAHQHTFELVDDGSGQQDVCSTCGFAVEVEEF
jgi:DNA-repair protein complementing XP-A cells